MIDEKQLVEVESVGAGSISYRAPSNPHIKRKWPRPGAKKKIPFEEIQEMFGSLGGEVLFTNFLLIKDTAVREALELPVDEVHLMDNNELTSLLKGNPAKLRENIGKLSDIQKERLVDIAIQKGVSNISHIEILKEHTGRDVYKEIQSFKEKTNTE